MERRGYRRPPKCRMNRSVSEEVLNIQKEMNQAYQGTRRVSGRNLLASGTVGIIL